MTTESKKKALDSERVTETIVKRIEVQDEVIRLAMAKKAELVDFLNELENQGDKGWLIAK